MLHSGSLPPWNAGMKKPLTFLIGKSAGFIWAHSPCPAAHFCAAEKHCPPFFRKVSAQGLYETKRTPAVILQKSGVSLLTCVREHGSCVRILPSHREFLRNGGLSSRRFSPIRYGLARTVPVAWAFRLIHLHRSLTHDRPLRTATAPLHINAIQFATMIPRSTRKVYIFCGKNRRCCVFRCVPRSWLASPSEQTFCRKRLPFPQKVFDFNQ